MKLLIKITLGSVLAATCLFGFTNAGQHAKAFIAGLRVDAENRLPTPHHLDVARQQLAAIEEQILGAETEMDGHAREEKRLAAEVSKLRNLQDTARTRLTALRPLLMAEYVSNGGCQQQQRDAARDAADLASFIHRSAEALVSREEALTRCRAVMDETHSALTETRTEFAAAKTRVEELALTLKQEEAIAAVKDATAAARGAVSDESKGDLARTLALLEKRAATLKRKNASRSSESLPAVRVPAESGNKATLLETVDAALGNKETAAR